MSPPLLISFPMFQEFFGFNCFSTFFFLKTNFTNITFLFTVYFVSQLVLFICYQFSNIYFLNSELNWKLRFSLFLYYQLFSSYCPFTFCTQHFTTVQNTKTTFKNTFHIQASRVGILTFLLIFTKIMYYFNSNFQILSSTTLHSPPLERNRNASSIEYTNTILHLLPFDIKVYKMLLGKPLASFTMFSGTQ